ncbi:MAG: carbon storage regulator CsrA [Chitinivibrionales bacterium]|nr:carbon storage regulator CsrA [Chitinivibrionales bacterium]MBD3396544.1 carbon storage regulator CsrA [Chitinivibrionales bacterium]
MLVLTRKLGESIRINDNITVKVVDLDSRHVKLGIEAPRHISVNREEIYERIQRENKAASGASASPEEQDQGLKNIADALKDKGKSEGS